MYEMARKMYEIKKAAHYGGFFRFALGVGFFRFLTLSGLLSGKTWL